MVRCRHHRRGGGSGNDPTTKGYKDRFYFGDTIQAVTQSSDLTDVIMFSDYGYDNERLLERVILSDTPTAGTQITLTDTFLTRDRLIDPPPLEMLAWWEFQNTLNDSHTNNLDVDGLNYAFQSSQKLWGTHAISINSSGYLTNSSRLFLPSGAFSIATWIYGLPTSSVLASIATTTTIHDFFILRTDKFIVSPNGDSNIEIALTLDGSGYTSRWNLICAGFIPNNMIWVSINNESRKFQSQANLTTINPGSTADFTIADYTTHPNPSLAFTGNMQMMAFWTRTLTSTDVSNLYNAGNGLPYPGV